MTLMDIVIKTRIKMIGAIIRGKYAETAFSADMPDNTRIEDIQKLRLIPSKRDVSVTFYQFWPDIER